MEGDCSRGSSAFKIRIKIIIFTMMILVAIQVFGLSRRDPVDLSENIELNNHFQQGTDYYNREQYRLALEHFYLAAMAGNREAAIQAGLMHDFGRGVPRNFSEASRWYTQAAQMGSRKGIFLLGHMEEYGEGRRKNFAKAFHQYSEAAALGESNAQFSLGQFYLQGKFVRTDQEKAVFWLRAAANQGNPAALDLLRKINLSRDKKKSMGADTSSD